MIKNQNKIHGSINSSGKKSGKLRYNRLRILKKHKGKFKKIDKITVKYRGDSFIAQINNRLFSVYGEIDDDKIEEWFGNKYIKINIDITHLYNLNNIELKEKK